MAVAVAAASTDRGKPAQIPDEALIERVLQGDQTAFDLLYQRYFKRVYQFVARRLNSREDTEETVQEVFINVLSSLGSFRGEAPFAAWVLGLTRRTIAGRFKRKRHPTVPLSTGDDDDSLADQSRSARREPSPLENYEVRERLERIRHIAETQLTPQQWRLFELHHLESYSIGDLARTLDKSEDAVKSNLYRVRKLLLAH